MKYFIVLVVLLLILFFLPLKVSWSAPEAPVEPPKPTVKEYAEKRVNEVFGGGWTSFNDLIYRESKWNNLAQNKHSTAFGLGQFLKSTWATVECVKTSDPYIQIDCTIKYVKQRYTHPNIALKHFIKYNYY